MSRQIVKINIAPTLIGFRYTAILFILYFRKIMKIPAYFPIFIVLALVGCQSTSNEDVEQPKFEQIENNNVDMAVVKVEPHLTFDRTLETNLEPIDDYSPTIPEKPVSNPDEKLNAKNKPADIINKQMCRDNVDVKYRAPNANGYKTFFPAKVQAQAVVIEVSANNKLKLKVTGWYSENQNLQQWRPYLTETPIAEKISLKKGAMIWDDRKNWTLCRLIKS